MFYIVLASVNLIHDRRRGDRYCDCFIQDCLQRHLIVGRNAGNLLPMSFNGFTKREEQHGTDEATRSCALEFHSTSSMIDIIERSGWSEGIDMVKSTNFNLLFTEDEEMHAKIDLERAKSAGLNLDGVRWVSEEEVGKVRIQSVIYQPLRRVRGFRPLAFVFPQLQGWVTHCGHRNWSQSYTSTLNNVLGNASI